MNKLITAAALAIFFASGTVPANADGTDFSGTYLGLHGTVIADGDHESVSSTDYGYTKSGNEAITDLNAGTEIGLRAGYNWLMPVYIPKVDQVQTVLLSLELNGSFGGPDGSKTRTTSGTDISKYGEKVSFTTTNRESIKMTWNTELRFRAGLLLGTDVVVYGFVGPVIAGVEDSYSYQSVSSDGDEYGNENTTDQFAFGFVAGGGAEWQVTSRFSIFAEVAYRDLSIDSSEYSYSGRLNSSDQSNMSDTSLIAGLNISF